MAKIRNFAEIAPNLPFTEYDFYEEYRGAFEKTDLGRMKRILPLHEMAKSLGLVSESLRPKRGRRSYFTPEGKVALMFLKMKTQKSFPKLMEALNGNIFYQMFCDIVIDPAHPLANYKLLDDIALGVDVKKIGGDTSYAGNTNRELCTSNGIHTSFVQKGKRAKEKREKDFVREDLARVRATTMEGSFGTQKEHYSMRRIKARMKMTEILYIFFGIHTANAVELSGRIAVLQPATG